MDQAIRGDETRGNLVDRVLEGRGGDSAVGITPAALARIEEAVGDRAHLDPGIADTEGLRSFLAGERNDLAGFINHRHAIFSEGLQGGSELR